MMMFSLNMVPCNPSLEHPKSVLLFGFLLDLFGLDGTGCLWDKWFGSGSGIGFDKCIIKFYFQVPACLSFMVFISWRRN